MKFEGGCYCGAVRYQVDSEPVLVAQCHCRECQYITGGNPNAFIGVPLKGFSYTKGAPATFSRPDLERPVTREFCPTCGTAIGTRPNGDRLMIVKVGTMDDPTQYHPTMAIYTVDAQPFHVIPDHLKQFDRLPGRPAD